MNMMTTTSFNRMGTRVLEREELARIVPSAFAAQAHESRSARYAYIPTSEIIDALAKEGFRPYHAKQGGSRIPGKADYTKHLIRFRHDSQGMPTSLNATVPEVALLNSHDGTSSYRIMAGLFRLVCLNGMMVADDQIGEVRVGHSGNITDKVIEGTYQVLNDTVRVMERPREWAQIALEHREQVALAEAVHGLRFDDESGLSEAIKPEQFLRPRRSADTGNDLWSTFNVLQENAIKGGLRGLAPNTAANARRRTRTVTTRPVNNIDGDVKLNRALWTLAERMAEIKGAG